MNEVIQAMLDRRSVRSFKSEMPKREDIEQIILAGLYAPSGKGRQASKIIAITNQEIRDKLAEINGMIAGNSKGFDPFYGAPLILIVLADKSVNTYLYDGSLVMENMLLAAHSLGLGGIWIHRAKEEFMDEQFKKLLENLGIEGQWEGIGNCAIGYIDGKLPPAAKRKEDRVYWVE